MKKIIIGSLLLMAATAAYAACTTHTYFVGNKIVTCTTCCDTLGNCTTNCF